MAYKASDIPADILARMSAADRAAIGQGQGKVVKEGDRPLATWRSRFRSQLEADYAERLDLDRCVIRWYYEPLKLRIAEQWYSPDFMVVLAGGAVEFHETKGVHRGRERGIAKLNAVAALYPMFVFVLVERSGGNWKTRRIKP